MILVLVLLSITFSPACAEDINMQNPFGVLEFLHWNHQWNNYKYPTGGDLEKAVA